MGEAVGSRDGDLALSDFLTISGAEKHFGTATVLQGIDLKAGGRNKRVHRSAPKSDNPYVKLLVKVRSGAAWVGRPAGPHAALLALAAAGAWQGDREAWQPRRGLQRGWLRANWSDMRRGCS